MQNYKSIQYTSQDSRRISFIIVATFFNLVEKLFSIEMLQNQMNIVVRLKYFIQLKYIWVPDLSQKVNFVVQAQNTFKIIFKHSFIYGF